MSDSLSIFTRAAAMLVEANTIQKAKELKDLALTAADWAKRKKLGNEAVDYARGYALEAARKLGEMLKETPRAEGNLKKGPVVTTGDHGKPTLKDLGITKKESSESQKLAALPRQVFEQVKSGEKTLSQAKKESTPHASVQAVQAPDVPEDAFEEPEPMDDPVKSAENAYKPTRDFALKIHALVREWEAMGQDAHPLISEQSVTAHLKAAAAEIRMGQPHALCPYCEQSGCRMCHQIGVVTKHIFDLAPKERRA